MRAFLFDCDTRVGRVLDALVDKYHRRRPVKVLFIDVCHHGDRFCRRADEERALIVPFHLSASPHSPGERLGWTKVNISSILAEEMFWVSGMKECKVVTIWQEIAVSGRHIWCPRPIPSWKSDEQVGEMFFGYCVM